MLRHFSLSLCSALLATAAFAQEAPRFAWQSGRVLTYKVEQSTGATETAEGKTTETLTRLTLVKKWQVLDVGPQGEATLQMTLNALRLETKRPDGEVMLFDSAKPDAGTPELKTEMTKYVGVPLATLRVDPLGRVVEVKESKFGPASRFESDLPFKLMLPGTAVTPPQAWERPFTIKLDPPQGAGEKYDALQRYECKTPTPVMTVAMTTVVKEPPATPGEMVPLLPLMFEGELVFDARLGCLKSARLGYQKELTDHQGEGSKYLFRTSYVEELVEAR